MAARPLDETALEELAYDLERARQIVRLKIQAEINRQQRQQDESGCSVKWPVTTALELAEDILGQAVSRLQDARETED
jgi:hypothetical protein